MSPTYRLCHIALLCLTVENERNIDFIGTITCGASVGSKALIYLIVMMAGKQLTRHLRKLVEVRKGKKRVLFLFPLAFNSAHAFPLLIQFFTK